MTKPFLPRRCRSARGGGAGGAKPFWGHPCRVTPCCSCPRETPGKCQGLAGHGAGWPERGTELRWEVFLHEAKHSGRLLSAPSSVKWTRRCLLQRPGSFPALAILSNFLNFHWTRLWWVFFSLFLPFGTCERLLRALTRLPPPACRGCASVPNRK